VLILFVFVLYLRENFAKQLRLAKMNKYRLIIVDLIFLFITFNVTYGEFMIDQRLREQNRLYPPPDPFFNTFYDKSYYLYGSQKPVYHVNISFS
jgi:hypothetical protein